ncbi:uncharacterized protein G2W53_022534 [Senna tora]|uniref:Uncharacterized protein n=1 Tax=Senna tora TaxID=362788 RepID=A0A834WI80_9FABA|nr:uncharacterized protein G2W53_022534 [Senna tora]
MEHDGGNKEMVEGTNDFVPDAEHDGDGNGNGKRASTTVGGKEAAEVNEEAATFDEERSVFVS